MTHRLIAYLSPHELHLFRSSGGQYAAVARHDWIPDGQQLCTLIEPHLQAGMICHLLLDLAEMDFRHERLPRLRKRDLRALLARRLAQAYRETPYRHGRCLDGGRVMGNETLALLLAFSAPKLLATLDSWLSDGKIRLSGITCLPLLPAQPLSRLVPEAPASLLIAPLPRQGLRISVHRRGELLFSRVIQGQTSPAQAHEEARRTRQYLLGTQLLDSDETLPLLALLPESQHHDWQNWQESQPAEARIRLISETEVARAAGLKLPETHTLPGLYVALLQAAGFPDHFALPAQRAGYRQMRWHHHLRLTIAVLLTGALAVGGKLSAEMVQTRKQLAALTAEISQEEAGLALPAERPATADEETQARQLLAPWLSARPELRFALQDISRGFEAVPEARLGHLHWLLAAPGTRLDETETVSESGDKAAAPGNLLQQAVIKGEITSVDDPLQANHLVEQLRLAMTRRGQLEVAIVRYPLELAPEKEMQETLTAAPVSMPFTLHLRWNK